MKQILKTLMLVMAMSFAFTQIFAYEDWTETISTNGKNVSHTWNIDVKAGQWLTYDMLFRRDNCSGWGYSCYIEESGQRTHLSLDTNKYAYQCKVSGPLQLYFSVGTSNLDANGYLKISISNISISNELSIESIELSDLSCGINTTKNVEVKSNPVFFGKIPCNWKSSNTSIASINEGVVTGVSAGKTTISASYGNFIATCNLEVLMAESIRIPDHKTICIGGSGSYISRNILPANANSNCDWVSLDESIATVSSGGYVTGVSEGVTKVVATTKDGSELQDTCIVSVKKIETLELLDCSYSSFSSGSVLVISDSYFNSNLCEWTSSNTNVVRVDESGNIDTRYPGTATITATLKDGSGLSSSCVVTVSDDIVELHGAKLRMCDEGRLSYSVYPNYGQTIEWRSSDESIISITEDGWMRPQSIGIATITALCSNGTSGHCQVAVIPNEFSEILEQTIGVGTYEYLSSVLYNYATQFSYFGLSDYNQGNLYSRYIWTSSDNSIAEVKDGRIYGNKEGSVLITGTAIDRRDSDCSFIANITSVSSVSLRDIEIHQFTSTKIQGTSKPVTLSWNSTFFNWESSDPTVASVDQNGYVRGYKVGTATITATSKYSNAQASCTVSVSPNNIKLKNLEVEISRNTIYPQIESEFGSISGSMFKWESSNPNVVSFDYYGNMRTNGLGEVTIIGKEKNSGLQISSNVKVYGGIEYTDLAPKPQGIKVNSIWSSSNSPWSAKDGHLWNNHKEESYLLYEVEAESYIDLSLFCSTDYYHSGSSMYVYVDGEIIYFNSERGVGNFYLNGEYMYQYTANIPVSPGTHFIFLYSYAPMSIDKWNIDNICCLTFENAIKTYSAKMDTIYLSREGILGAEALRLHDNLSDFTGLCVFGPFDSYDWKTMKEMTNLKCLDISGITADSYPANCNDSVRAVIMSKHIDEINENPFKSRYLTYMCIPDNVKSISGRIQDSGNRFFLEGALGVEQIDERAFAGSGILGNLIFPSLKEVKDYSFSSASYIESFTAPQLKKIGSYAFANTYMMSQFNAELVDTIYSCAFMASSLDTVTMPLLKYIGKEAFSTSKSGFGTYSNYDKNRNSYSYTSSNYYGPATLKSIFAPSVEYVGEMAFFKQLNLSEVNVENAKFIGPGAFEGTNLRQISIPQVTIISAGAFRNSNLKSLIAPSAISIGTSALRDNKYIEVVDAPNAASIDIAAFMGCDSLKTADVRRAITISDRSFYGCKKLENVNASKAETIGLYSFCNSGLKSIKLPNVTTLSRSAFRGCDKAISLELSDKLTAIGDSTFFGCTGLETVTLPASLAHLPAKCFNGSINIKKISINAPAPPSVGETPFTMQTVYTAQLYVPESSIALYQAHDYWKHFYYYNANPDVLTDLVLSTQLVLGDVRTDKVRLTIQPGASMSMSGSKSQDFRSVTFMANGSGSGMFLSECERINSDETSVVLDMNGLTWYYICMPFDVEMSDIQNATGALLAVHYYNGANRAAKGTGNNWTRMYSGTLNAGTGYIIQASKATTLTLPASFETKDVAFQPYNINHSLEANVSTSLSNQGWNFIGNPYMTYYDIAKMNFEAPITVREGNTYVAYSTIDDEYVLRPLQPFFVQCPEGVNKITFDASGRQTTANIVHDAGAAPARMIKNAVTRNIIDITMSDGVQNDRTRVVVNKAASDAYELSCDAAKMMSEGAVQIFTIGNDVRYAINEGPQSCGTVQLAYAAPSEGEYTIALTRGTMPVTLYDLVEGKSINLNEETYSFYTEAGEYEDRFVLILENTNGINTLPSAPSEIEYYDLTGRRVSRPEGIGIKRQDGIVSKQIVR